jgi:hypothetical protein
MSLFKRTPEEKQADTEYEALVHVNQRTEALANGNPDPGLHPDPAVADAERHLGWWLS